MKTAVTLSIAFFAIAIRACPAQIINPVYVDDSPIAEQTLAQAVALAGVGNTGQAARSLAELLHTSGDRLVPAAGDSDLFVSVRATVHKALTADPALLTAYISAEEPWAASQLKSSADGPIAALETVEREAFLTPTGFEASLRLALLRLESARFDAAARTLAELSGHPSRQDRSISARAAETASLLARYVDSANTRELARTWNAIAGLAGAEEPSFAPGAAPPIVSGVREGAHSVGPAEFMGGTTPPLWSRTFTPLDADPTYSVETIRSNSTNRHNSALWVQPTVVADTVFVNDGAVIRALDRLTLDPIWEVVPPSATRFSGYDPDDVWRRRRFADQLKVTIEDVSAVAVSSGVVVTATGLAENGVRRGDPRLHAFDARTGKVLWSVDVARADTRTRDFSPKGPPLISGGLAVVPIRKQTATARVSSFALSAYDLRTGRQRWVRPIASAGSMMLGGPARLQADAPLLSEGIVYVQDPIGVVAAVEAHTGAPVWVRRVQSLDLPITSASTSPWEYREPVLLAGGLYAVSPNRAEVLRLSPETGELLARIPASRLNYPRYLLACAGHLIAVSDSALYAVSADQIPLGRPERLDLLGQQLNGRVVVTDSRLVAPTATGYAVVDPTRAAETRIAQMERPGTIITLEDQVIIVDDARAHSYVDARTADSVLRDRMRLNPDDPRPAIAYAGFAWRTGRPDAVLEAADFARGALDRSETIAQPIAERERLFDQLLTFAFASLSGSHKGTQAQADRLIEIMRAVARSPQHTASTRLIEGAFHQHYSRNQQALDSYHAVLADADLSASSFREGGRSTPAGHEASQRIREMVRALGPASYKRFEALSDDARAKLGASPVAESLEALARRFPPIGAPYLLQAASLRSESGSTAAALDDLTKAVGAAECARQAGLDARHAPLELAAARLADALLTRGQYATAASMLRRLALEDPRLVVTIRDTARPAADWAALIATDLRTDAHFPRVGSAFAGKPQIIPEAYQLTPQSRDHRARTSEYVVLLMRSQSRVAIWGLPGFVPNAPETEGLVELWSQEYHGNEPTLLRTEPDHIILSTLTPAGISLERIDIVDAVSRWRTPALTGLFPRDPAFAERAFGPDDQLIQRAVPADNSVLLTDTLVAFDDRMIAMFERSGRTAIISTDSGKVVATLTLPLDLVYDADINSGTIAAVGEAPAGAEPARHLLVLRDADVPNAQPRILPLSAPPRSVRFIAPGRLLTIHDDAVACYDTQAGAKLWAAENLSADGIREVWDFGDRLYVLSPQGEARTLDAATGTPVGAPTTVTKRLGIYSPIDATRIDAGVLFSSASGAVLLDRDGTPIGTDSIRASGSLLSAIPTRDAVVIVDSRSRTDAEGRRIVRVHHLTRDSLAVQTVVDIYTSNDPIDATGLQDRLVMTIGGAVVVLGAPVDN